MGTFDLAVYFDSHSKMIRAFVTLTVLLKLASAYHFPIPTITKEVDGPKSDVNVEVEIDTGDEPTVPPTLKPRQTTKKPSIKCANFGERCSLLENLKCCGGLECSTLLAGVCRLPPKPVESQCKKAGESCTPGTASKESDPSSRCCPNHLCDLDNNVCRRVANVGPPVSENPSCSPHMGLEGEPCPVADCGDCICCPPLICSDSLCQKPGNVTLTDPPVEPPVSDAPIEPPISDPNHPDERCMVTVEGDPCPICKAGWCKCCSPLTCLGGKCQKPSEMCMAGEGDPCPICKAGWCKCCSPLTCSGGKCQKPGNVT